MSTAEYYCCSKTLGIDGRCRSAADGNATVKVCRPSPAP